MRTYYGSGRYKYGNAMLNLWLTFEYEFTPELRDIYLENMLVNPSGVEGTWQPLDLLMQHTVKALKELA